MTIVMEIIRSIEQYRVEHRGIYPPKVVLVGSGWDRLQEWADDEWKNGRLYNENPPRPLKPVREVKILGVPVEKHP